MNRKPKRAQKRLATRYAQKLLDDLADGLMDAEQDALVRGTARVIMGALRDAGRKNKGTNADGR